ncbi:uncharacterized protein TNCV_2922831 [Trichonephila clavipes]|nr:uncharacterized protein TNCV_2922831 [Trichonephila clavipes]
MSRIKDISLQEDLDLLQELPYETSDALTAARQCWTKSHSIKAAIISHVLDVCGLKQLQDVSEDLQSNRIKIYGKQIADFIEIFEKNINPFDESLDKDSLYNIATAKPVPENVANFLLSIEKNGEDQFIDLISQ